MFFNKLKTPQPYEFLQGIVTILIALFFLSKTKVSLKNKFRPWTGKYTLLFHQPLSCYLHCQPSKYFPSFFHLCISYYWYTLLCVYSVLFQYVFFNDKVQLIQGIISRSWVLEFLLHISSSVSIARISLFFFFFCLVLSYSQFEPGGFF